MKWLVVLASVLLLWPATAGAQRRWLPKTEASGHLRILREWRLSETLRARAEHVVFPEWVAAVEQHKPGEADSAAIRIGNWPGQDLDLVVKWIFLQLHLDEAVRQAKHLTPQVRLASLARRGAILHADVALRVGSRQTTLRISPFTYSVVQSQDGRDVGWSQADVNLEVGRALLTVLKDADCGDARFDALWYAATAAPLLRARKIGYAEPHLVAGLEVFPEDPRLLFYLGAVHEVLAAPRSQHVLEVARPPFQYQVRVGSEDRELNQAEKLLKRALASDPGDAEIRLHHARVLGHLGEHAKAAAELSTAAGKLTDPDLAFYAALFRGEEESALGHRDAARAAFERARALFPRAQSPLLALSRLSRRDGDRAAALDALRRLFALPRSEDERVDPWWGYYESHVRDARALMTALSSRVEEEAIR